MGWLKALGLTTSASRMPQMADPATLGPSFFTPTQADFRNYLSRGFDGGRTWQADPSKAQRPGVNTAPADANASLLRRNADGTADQIRLEATGDGWVDLGGATPRDFKVIQW